MTTREIYITKKEKLNLVSRLRAAVYQVKYLSLPKKMKKKEELEEDAAREVNL